MCHFAGMTTVITGNRVRRSMSSSYSRRWEVMEQMWYAADCSRSVQRRLEKLGCRRLRVRYGEQTVHETKRNADAFETPTLLHGEVSQRDYDGARPWRHWKCCSITWWTSGQSVGNCWTVFQFRLVNCVFCAMMFFVWVRYLLQRLMLTNKALLRPALDCWLCCCKS